MAAMTSIPDVRVLTGPSGLPVEALVHDVDDAHGLVVFLPGALSPTREDRAASVFHRWSWAGHLAGFSAMTLADPALGQDARLDGAWFIHPEIDVIREIAAVVLHHAEERGIPRERILFYGSSLGGFGALAAAAATRTRAVAEVPQIDFRHWLPGAVRAVETMILGTSVGQFRLAHPERVDVWSRFVFERHIPPFTILTNEKDRCFPQQLGLIGTVRDHPLYTSTRAELVVTAQTSEHQTLPLATALAWVRTAAAA